MGKTSWGALCLLFACWAQGAPTLTVATDVWPPFRMLAENDDFQGLDIDILRQLQARSGIVLTLKRVPWGRALKQMQTGQVDLMIGLAHTEERAAFIDYLQPSYYQCRPAFYGKARRRGRSQALRGSARPRDGYVLNSAYFPPSMATPSSTSTGSPPKTSCSAWWAGPPAPDDRDRLPGGLRPEPAQRRRPRQGALPAPNPVVLYLGMSKHSPHHELGPKLAQALQSHGGERRDSGAGQALPALTLGGNALLSCSFPACPGGPRFLGDPVYLALIRRQQRWQRRWLLLLSLLTLALFLLSLALGEFVLLPWQPLGIWSCASCWNCACRARPAGSAGGGPPLPAAVPCSR